jgi:hypothetical protein
MVVVVVVVVVVGKDVLSLTLFIPAIQLLAIAA